MTRRKLAALGASVLAIGLLIAVPAVAQSNGHWFPMKLFLKNGLKNYNTGSTLEIASGSIDGTTSTTVGAVTLKSSVNVTDGDLVLNVENSAGDNLLTVDEQGKAVILTDLDVAGNDITGTGTGATLKIESATADATTSGTVGSITLKGANITATDLLLDVQDSSANHVLTLTEAGDMVALSDISAAGNGFNCSGTGATCLVTSSVADATTSGTVGSITLKAGADITASDLLLDVQDSSGNHALTVTEAGSLTALTSIVATTTLTVGGGTAVVKVIKGELTDLDIGSTAAGAATAVTGSVTDATLGDLCVVAPLQDDAAWDEGGLTCFVESAGTVKVLYHADGTGGDPAATNDYNIMLVRF